MSLTASGTEIILTSGEYEARIVTVGAGLAALTLRGVDLVLPHAADELLPGYLGKTLVPWPNRIANGRYTWRDTTYEVPVNESSTGSALHGLVCWVNWSVVHSDNDSVTLGTLIAAQPGYPWTLESFVTYALHADTGLSITITTKNIGTETAPYGSSTHPYLTIGQRKADGYIVEMPAAKVALVDDRMIPTHIESVESADMDFRQGRSLGSQSVDHAFTDLPSGAWTVRFTDAESTSWVEAESSAPWVQLYTGDHCGRIGIATEPMTCAPDAFNNGIGLIELEPQQSHTLTMSIRGHIEA